MKSHTKAYTMHTGSPPVVLCLLLLLGWEPVRAQMENGKSIVTAELLSHVLDAREPFDVGIRFTILPQWYLYWKNPGDAGLPIEATWELPSGWKAGELRFPVPSKFVHDDIVAYGYKKEVILLTTITPDSEKVGQIRVKLDWLVCRESCLKGNAKISLSVPAPEEQRKNAAGFLEKAQALLPGTQKHEKVFLKKASVKQQSENWSLEASFEGHEAARMTDFYPEINKDILIDFRSIRVADGILRLTFAKQEDSAPSTTVNGLLIKGEAAYAFSIPIQFSPNKRRSQ